MKKMLAILMMITVMLAPIGAKAAAPEIGKDGLTVVFNPEIERIEQKSGKTSVTIRTTSTAYLYIVQVSDRKDFKGAKPYCFRGSDWEKGCVAVWLTNRGDKNLRVIWYDGRIISYRAVAKPQRLTIPASLLRQIEKKYQCRKYLTVPEKGRYIRVRCCYYGGGSKVYSEWSAKGVR